MRIGHAAPVAGVASAGAVARYHCPADGWQPRCGILRAMSRLSDPLPVPRDPSGPYRLCFVCLGNICRSPMAEVVARAQLAQAGLAGRVVVDSSGTGDWHVGAQMHQGARRALVQAGYDGSAHRARQFHASWLPERDLLLAMDASNLDTLRRYGRDDPDHRIRLFGQAAGLGGKDVPDPYGADPAEFARVLTMIESGTAHLVTRLADLLRAPTQPGR